MDLRGLRLFSGFTEEEMNEILTMKSCQRKKYSKDEILFHAGDRIPGIGIVEKGNLTMLATDVNGNETISERIYEGGVFGAALVLTNETLDYTVKASENAEILYFSMEGLSSSIVAKIEGNLLKTMVIRTRELSKRILYVTPKTIRERILLFLEDERKRNQSDSFDIPFSRDEMAEYLNVDRTALSKELSRMQSEGLIEFKKNHFVLKNR